MSDADRRDRTRATPTATRASTTAPPRSVAVAVPRFALDIDEAAASLGLSRDTFDRHVRPLIREIPVGRRIVIPIVELERWAREGAMPARPRR